MKKYISIVTAALLVFTACNDLDTAPVNQYTDANFWSADRAQYMLNTAYSQMFNVGKMLEWESLSDNVLSCRGTSNSGRLILTGQANADTGIFSSEWSDGYTCLKSCHAVLDNVPNVDGLTDAQRTDLLSQARFIRAMIYLRLITFYGDVPFFTTDITADESKSITRSPKAEILSFVRSELEEIIPQLPNKDNLATSLRGKITQGAAIMLLARSYLYQQDTDWAAVERYCNMLMSGQYGSYELCDSYKAVFQEENEYNDEVILDRAYVQNLISWDNMQDHTPISRDGRLSDRVPLQSLVDNYIMLSGYTITEAGTDYDPTNPYANRDPRMTETIIYDGYDWAANVNDWFPTKGPITIDPAHTDDPGRENSDPQDIYDPSSNTSRTGYYIRKWYAPMAKGQWGSGLNIIMMRYADVLLMYAEAMNEQGKMSAAVWDATVKPIRARAGFTNGKALDYPAVGQGEMRTILRNERRSELAMEGLRYFDVMRWKAASTYFTGKPMGASFATDLGATYNFNEGRGYLFAVPQSQIDLNSNLTQNPGW